MIRFHVHDVVSNLDNFVALIKKWNLISLTILLKWLLMSTVSDVVLLLGRFLCSLHTNENTDISVRSTDTPYSLIWRITVINLWWVQKLIVFDILILLQSKKWMIRYDLALPLGFKNCFLDTIPIAISICLSSRNFFYILKTEILRK
jgi:hypothetical protein